jgi:uncharacterized membrane protein YbhN (UPF0104 family)
MPSGKPKVPAELYAAMKRFRLSTLLLLVVIAALSVALMEQRRRSAGREATLEARLAETNRVVKAFTVSVPATVDGTPVTVYLGRGDGFHRGDGGTF